MRTIDTKKQRRYKINDYTVDCIVWAYRQKGIRIWEFDGVGGVPHDIHNFLVEHNVDLSVKITHRDGERADTVRYVDGHKIADMIRRMTEQDYMVIKTRTGKDRSQMVLAAFKSDVSLSGHTVRIKDLPEKETEDEGKLLQEIQKGMDDTPAEPEQLDPSKVVFTNTGPGQLPLPKVRYRATELDHLLQRFEKTSPGTYRQYVDTLIEALKEIL